MPAGTVTFVLTDIEGSTRMWRARPRAMSEAVRRHEHLIHREVERFGGRLPMDHGEGDSVFAVFARGTDAVAASAEIHGEGDSVFAVFARGTDAVAASAEIQGSLTTERWPEGIDMRVRIGVHTGEAELRAGNYYGAAVSRAARIRSLCWGGQTLMSQATYELVRDELPEGCSVRDVGVYVLKDFDKPERVFELRHAGVRESFPAPRSGEMRPNNLPLAITTFVGRDVEVAEVERLLSSGRLVSVTGPGGSGKSRLAVEVARRMVDDFEDGVHMVELAGVVDPALVPATIAHSVGVREGSERSLEEALAQHLRHRDMLLLLDNFERVIDAAPFVAELLRACPRLTILVTTRACLRLSGEHEFPLAPLSVPEVANARRADQLQRCEAVRLFVERVRAVNPRFELSDSNAALVAELTNRLDGLPLAIELAAVRLKLLPLPAVLERLRGRLDLLKGGARDLPARQQTLRSLIDWDYELLQGEERRAFRTFGVFAGSFSLDAAAAVIDEADDLVLLEQLESLVGKSLLRQSPADDDDARFSMLQTIGDRAVELLHQSGEAPRVLRRHALFYLQLAERADENLRGRDQAFWLGRLELDHDNLRAALQWASEQEDGELLVRLATALVDFWGLRGHLTEGWRWCQQALELSAGQPSLARASLLMGAGLIGRARGDYARSETVLEEALRICRDVADDDGVARALRHLGALRFDQGDLDAARSFTQQSLDIRRRMGHKLGEAQALNNLGVMAQVEDEPEHALELYGESGALFRELSAKEGIARSLMNQGATKRDIGDLDAATDLLIQSLRLWRELADTWDMTDTLEDLAGVACERGRWEVAARLFGAADGLRKGIGAQRSMADDGAYESRIAALRNHLAEDALTEAWTDGFAMSVDEVVAFALDTITA